MLRDSAIESFHPKLNRHATVGIRFENTWSDSGKCHWATGAGDHATGNGCTATVKSLSISVRTESQGGPLECLPPTRQQ